MWSNRDLRPVVRAIAATAADHALRASVGWDAEGFRLRPRATRSAQHLTIVGSRGPQQERILVTLLPCTASGGEMRGLVCDRVLREKIQASIPVQLSPRVVFDVEGRAVSAAQLGLGRLGEALVFDRRDQDGTR